MYKLFVRPQSPYLKYPGRDFLKFPLRREFIDLSASYRIGLILVTCTVFYYQFKRHYRTSLVILYFDLKLRNIFSIMFSDTIYRP